MIKVYFTKNNLLSLLFMYSFSCVLIGFYEKRHIYLLKEKNVLTIWFLRKLDLIVKK